MRSGDSADARPCEQVFDADARPCEQVFGHVRQQPIAIVGVGSLMPGSTDVGGFWRSVLEGRDLLTDVPPTHWLVEDYYDPDPAAPDKTYSRRGAFLPPIDFDPVAYGIPPNTVAATDTSQLLALMVAEQVLTDATGGDLAAMNRERVSVILGLGALELLTTMAARLERPVWLKALRESGVEESEAQAICDRIASHYVPWQEATFPGLLGNVVAGRIANKFDLRGTNFTADAACASSFAAVASAVNELALGRSDLVITGGVDAFNDISMYMCFSKTPALSPTGDCRPFSDAADGTILGEGLVMFALKRLEDAERDNDRIYAVVRGIGSSSDGRATAVYAPLPEGQARALRRTYEVAGYGPETVELVEAHGTGTKAGDAAEFAALRATFEQTGRAGRWCALGSVKSQVGHTKGAAGAAGMLKAVLALQHKVFPPTLKVERPNPELGMESSPLYLNTHARPWVRGSTHPRRASVSSFGFGGTNFHVTLEEYLPGTRSGGGVPASRTRTMPAELVLISAPTVTELVNRARGIGNGDLRQHDLAWVARETQRTFHHDDHVRLAVVATDTAELASRLEQAVMLIENNPGASFSTLSGLHYGAGPTALGDIAFLFPGQGSQYTGMGADVAMHFPAAGAVWDWAAAIGIGDRPLHEVVFPIPAFTDLEREAQERLLTATEWAQPALAVSSLALLNVLSGLGLASDCVAGHSFGELVGLYVAGAFDEETLVRLARRRGELMRDAAAVPGMMVAVSGSREDVEAVIASCGDEKLWVANDNAPRQVVVSGTASAVEIFEGKLAKAGLLAKRLNAATGFHSPLVMAASGPLRHFLSDVDIRGPQIDVYGNADAAKYPSDPDAVRHRIADHLASGVRFVDQIEAMYCRGVRTFIEIGAGSAVTRLVGQILGDRQHTAVSLDRKGGNGVTSLYDALGLLCARGMAMNLDALWAGYAPPVRRQEAPKSKAVVKISGANFDRRYPPADGADALPPPNPPRSTEDPLAGSSIGTEDPLAGSSIGTEDLLAGSEGQFAGSSIGTVGPFAGSSNGTDVVGDGWLRVHEDLARRTMDAHAAYQRAMADSHVAFLKLADTWAGGLGAAVTANEKSPDRVPQTSNDLLAGPGTEDPLVGSSIGADDLLAGSSMSTDSSVPDFAITPPVQPMRAAPTGNFTAPDPVTPVDTVDAEAVDLGSVLLSVVADKTGYPPEILDAGMELEADLGIDSIKRVEILSALREKVPGLPDVDAMELGKLRTIGQIVDKLKEATHTDGVSSLDRTVVRTVVAEASGLAMAGLGDGPLAVTDDGGGIAHLVVERLTAHGLSARVVTDVAPDVAGVIFLGGLRDVGSEEQALAVNVEAFRTASAVARCFEEFGGVFVTVQDTGGDFGLGGLQPTRAWLGGVAALAKTVAQEWTTASVKAIDCERGGRTASAIAEDIVRELLAGGSTLEVGLRADGTRTTVELVKTRVESVGTPRIGPESVIVATGGGRGVTAASLRALAERYQPRLVLIGRTPLLDEPDELRGVTDDASLKQIVTELELRRTGQRPAPAYVGSLVEALRSAREIRGTLAALARAGSEVRYVPVDVRDGKALAVALDEVRQSWGPITGVIHGAGVLADKRVVDKTVRQFEQVFGTKVVGLLTLLDATENDPLDVLCVFSSVVARYGNPGQSDYAMANEVLNQVASAEAVKRPGSVVRSIAWGPWHGGMVTPEVERHFRGLQVPLVPVAAGTQAFVAELGGQPGEAQVVIAPGDTDGQLLGAARQRAMEAEIRLSARTHSYLADHTIAGAPVVPVAMVMEWFAAAARESRPREHTAMIRDISVLRKISLNRFEDSGTRLAVRCTADGPKLRMELLGEDGRSHYRATVHLGGVDAGPMTAWAAPPDLQPVDQTEIYDGRVLFHGPRFQAIRSLHGVSRLGAIADVVGLEALGWTGLTGTVWRTDPAATDACLQLSLLWAEKVLGGAALPMSVGEYRLHREGPASGPMRCVVRAKQVHIDHAKCDIGLVDADGSPRAELLDVNLVLRPE
ncbi:type I polyketide synthase [Kibdelosporangium philippinense]|nr:type I polyketide synthase [Kibdelosporangium philippinense]